MEKDTLFRIASMTKPITAIGIMILADEGKLSPDDDVAKYLPEFTGQMLVGRERGKDTVTLKKPARPVKLRDLLTHTGGHRRRTRRASTTCTRSATARWPRRRWPPPCGRCSSSRAASGRYSNSGIDTLGRVIEVVSGETYEAFLQKRVFDPLGDDRHHLLPDAGPDEAARRHLRQGQGRQAGRRSPNALIGLPANPKHPIPAGGLVSTRGRPGQALPDDAQQGRARRQAHPEREGRRRDDADADRRHQDRLRGRDELRLRLGGGARSRRA